MAACATASPSPAPRPSAPTAATAALSGALRWMSNSAEYRAITTQTYALAARRLEELAPAVQAGSWGVILDADETVLDNGVYERRRTMLDSAYTDSSWNDWVRERAAVPVPGAVAFTQRVHALGGRVVIVTDRTEPLCDATRDNLRAVGIVPDLVLCKTTAPADSDKNARFARVQNGTASPGLPALSVLEWIGDNIKDFPGFTQRARNDPTALALFGRRYFALPNPVYGSWTDNTGS
ncbi:MAG TPA: HAD family acid phosphatase [Gemmatimonadaceae bacterium]